MKLNMVRDAKTEEMFYRFTGQKRWAKKSVLPLTNEKGELATTNMEKADVLREFFSSDFTGSQGSHSFYIPEHLGRNWGS